MTSRKIAVLLGAIALAFATLVGASTQPASAAGTAHRGDRDCSDFSTQAAAQNYFISIGGPSSDPDRLDSDGDGVACESNPCPCSTSTGGGGGGGGSTPPQDTRPPLKVDRAIVIKVVDGDTVDVRVKRSGLKVRVRLLGIDTPEVYGGVECGGRAASANAKRMLPRGTRVLLTSDRSQDLKDRYGRLLRYVKKISNQTDIGKAQLKKGHARVYVYRGKPFNKVRPYRAAEASARRADVGIWGACR